jgi:hypothetical protein
MLRAGSWYGGTSWPPWRLGMAALSAGDVSRDILGVDLAPGAARRSEAAEDAATRT